MSGVRSNSHRQRQRGNHTRNDMQKICANAMENAMMSYIKGNKEGLQGRDTQDSKDLTLILVLHAN